MRLYMAPCPIGLEVSTAWLQGQVYSWDLGKKLGEIPQPKRTYNVMGNANCQGLVIGETTLGGLNEPSNVGKDFRNGTILDYGQLIWITLQRAATAREAIDVMAHLTAEYGYASDMEGFSISDPSGEVWYMEMIGKGGFEKGTLHVALRVPDGYVAAHANQARITTFLPCDDPSTCKASPDVVSFAIKRGYWKGELHDPSFSFSDVYDPVTFSGARFCEARVWTVFRGLADPADFNSSAYLDYARGFDLSRRMPLFVRPRRRLTRDDLHALMSDHFEGTWFDPSNDVGAGAELSPYRWNGLEGRTTAQSTSTSASSARTTRRGTFVATIRPPPMPKPMRAVLHWGADDHSWAPKIPVHGGASRVHPSYDDAECTGRDACRRASGLHGTVTEFSMESAWWINQIVADQVYSRKARAAPLVHRARKELDEKLEASLATADAAARAKFEAGDIEGGKEILTGTSDGAAWWSGDRTVDRAGEGTHRDVVDGRVMTLDSSMRCAAGRHPPGLETTGRARWWRTRARAHYREP